MTRRKGGKTIPMFEDLEDEAGEFRVVEVARDCPLFEEVSPSKPMLWAYLLTAPSWPKDHDSLVPVWKAIREESGALALLFRQRERPKELGYLRVDAEHPRAQEVVRNARALGFKVQVVAARATAAPSGPQSASSVAERALGPVDLRGAALAALEALAGRFDDEMRQRAARWMERALGEAGL